LTPPSTSKSDKQKFKAEEKKVQIIMIGVVCPILITVAILIGFGVIDTGYNYDFIDEKAKYRFEKTGNYPEQLLRPNEILMSTNLFNLDLTLDEEIGLVEEILSRVDDLQCMNVNWYGTGGKRQIFYNESVGDIQQVFADLDITYSMVDEPPFLHFIANPVLQVQIEVSCAHVWSVTDIPNEYDQEYNDKVAMSPYISCLDHPFFQEKQYCNLLPKKPLGT